MEKSGKMIRISGRNCVNIFGYILALISGAAATCEKVIRPYDSNKVEFFSNTMINWASEDLLCKKPLSFVSNALETKAKSELLARYEALEIQAYDYSAAAETNLDALSTLMAEDQWFSERSANQRALLQQLSRMAPYVRPQPLSRRKSLDDDDKDFDSSINNHAAVSESLSCPPVISGRIDVVTDTEYPILPSEFAVFFKPRPYHIGWTYIFYPERKEIELMLKQSGSAPLLVSQGIYSNISVSIKLDKNRSKSAVLCTVNDSSLSCKTLRFHCDPKNRTSRMEMKLTIYAKKNLLQRKCIEEVFTFLGKSGETRWIDVDI